MFKLGKETNPFINIFLQINLKRAKDFAKKTEKRLKNIPAQTTRISGQRLTVANKYAEYFYDEDDFHKLKFKHKNRILAKMEREENRFIKKKST